MISGVLHIQNNISWQKMEKNTACPYHLYRVYQKEVNILKKDSKLKSMKYLVKILFCLDKLISCLPQVDNSSVATFISQAKMQLRQVNENQNRFELSVTSSCEVTISLHEVRGQFLCMCHLQLRFDL